MHVYIVMKVRVTKEQWLHLKKILREATGKKEKEIVHTHTNQTVKATSSKAMKTIKWLSPSLKKKKKIVTCLPANT